MPRLPKCICEKCPACVKRRKNREWYEEKRKDPAWLAEYQAKQREYQRRKKLEDPQYKERARERSRQGSDVRRAKIKAILQAAKDKPCVDCGIRLPPEIMDLDHVRGEKKFGVSNHRAKYSTFAELREEIAKCDVRCSNCHRLRHYYERNPVPQLKLVA